MQRYFQPVMTAIVRCRLAVVAVAMTLFLFCGFVSTAHATLLVYEPFNYTAGSNLAGQSGAQGTIGGWNDTSSGGVINDMINRANGSSENQLWTGIPEGGYPQSGGYLEGQRRNDNEAHIALDPSVTAHFTDGSTIWLSYVAAATTTGELDNHHKPNVAIGEGALLDDRAKVADGQAIGAGAKFNIENITAAYWDNGENRSSSFLGRLSPQQLIIAKIEFGPLVDTVSAYNFDISLPYTTLTEADFDGAELVSITSINNLRNALFDTLSFHGSRANFDEIRVATTFDEAVGGEAVGGGAVVPEPSSIAMFGIGALGLFGYSTRRRQTSTAA